MASISESWAHITDPKLRKQIQNRLAQRRHREKRRCGYSSGPVAATNTRTFRNSFEDTQEAQLLQQQPLPRSSMSNYASPLKEYMEWKSPGSWFRQNVSSRRDSVLPDLENNSVHLPTGRSEPELLQKFNTWPSVEVPVFHNNNILRLSGSVYTDEMRRLSKISPDQQNIYLVRAQAPELWSLLQELAKEAGWQSSLVDRKVLEALHNLLRINDHGCGD